MSDGYDRFDHSRRAMSPPDAFLPLKSLDVLILTMLAGGDRHGYGIRQDIVAHTEGALRPEAGNLYRSIRRLIDMGFVAEAATRPAPDAGDERRRYFRLSAAGRQALATELVRLRTLVRLAESRDVIPPEPAR